MPPQSLVDTAAAMTRRRRALTDAMIVQSEGHLTPSEHGRALVRGAIDYHVHVAPDFVSRRISDIDLANRCLETGRAGFGLKSHYCPTAERAQVVAAGVPASSCWARSRSTARSAG